MIFEKSFKKKYYLFSGLKWRYLRAKLTPIFTSGKIKKMFYLTKEAGCDLLDYMNGALEKNEKTNESSAIKEFKTLIAGFTVDVTSSCAFGINSNSFKKEKAEFKTFATKINDASIRRSVDWKVVFFAPFLAKWLRCVFFGKESSQFFRHVFQEAMKERESRKIFRNDFLDLLLELKNNQNEELKNNKAAGFEDETWSK